MSIWKRHDSLESLNKLCSDCAIAHLGIKLTNRGDDWLEATMPIDERTTQPMGWLHGGVSCVLAETVGSIAGYCCVEDPYVTVGLEINASHLRPISHGVVTARATPARIGRSVQVWNIDLRDDDGKLCCQSRLTLSVVVAK